MSTQVKVTGGDKIKKFLKKIVEQTESAHVDAGFTDPKYAEEAYKNEYGGIYKVDEDWKERARAYNLRAPKNKKIRIPEYWNITPRPFMLDAMHANSKNWGEVLKSAVIATKYDIKKSLGILGAQMQKDIQNQIIHGEYEETHGPFAAVKGNKKPLVDKGGMLGAVRFEVNK